MTDLSRFKGWKLKKEKKRKKLILPFLKRLNTNTYNEPTDP